MSCLILQAAGQGSHLWHVEVWVWCTEVAEYPGSAGIPSSSCCEQEERCNPTCCAEQRFGKCTRQTPAKLAGYRSLLLVPPGEQRLTGFLVLRMKSTLSTGFPDPQQVAAVTRPEAIHSGRRSLLLVFERKLFGMYRSFLFCEPWSQETGGRVFL